MPEFSYDFPSINVHFSNTKQNQTIARGYLSLLFLIFTTDIVSNSRAFPPDRKNFRNFTFCLGIMHNTATYTPIVTPEYITGGEKTD